MERTLHHNEILLIGNYTRGSGSLCSLHCNTNFPPLTKGSLVVTNCQKKFDLERSLEVGQISLHQLFGKNPTIIIADLLHMFAIFPA